MKPGPKTSEFWLSLLAMGGIETLNQLQQIPGPAGHIAAAVVAAAYAISRGYAKT